MGKKVNRNIVTYCNNVFIKPEKLDSELFRIIQNYSEIFKISLEISSILYRLLL